MSERNTYLEPHRGPAPQGDLAQTLLARGDARSFADDLSNAVLFALERRHLEHLSLKSVPPPVQVRPLSPGDLFFLKLSQIGHGSTAERSLDLLNLQNVLGTFRGGTHSMILGLESQGAASHLYLGARRLHLHVEEAPATYYFVENLRRAVQGNLPGTRFHSFPPAGDAFTCPEGEIYEHLERPMQECAYLAAITGIPSLRGEREDQFAQSLDRFSQALQGQRYLLLLIAEPIAEPQVDEVLRDCLRMSSEIHSMVRTSAGFSQAVSDAVAKARAEGRVRSEAEAKSHADTAAKGQAKQPGGLIGGALGASLTLMLTALAGPALGAASLGVIGLTSSVGSVLGGSVSDNIGTTKSTSQSTTWGDSITESLTETSSRSDTSSITLEYLNKTAEYCERLLDAYVHRLQRAKNLGMWNVGIYFFADDPATFAQGQAQLRSLYSGKETYFEPLRTVDLSPVRASIKLVLSTFSNPVLQLSASVPGAAPTPLPHPLGKLHRGLSTPLHTEELALLMNLPRREVPGLKLEMVADFGVNPRPMNPADQIRIGSVVSGWSRLDIPVAIGRKDLTRHVFVTGITGSGKTNSCFALLKAGARGAGRERAAGPVPFLVIEPAKGEYRGLMAEKEFADLRVYTAGDETISPFRINPFQFVPGTNLVTHLDYLKSIFNASFPMYAAMPYLLEEAVVRLYESKGWDLVRSTNKNLDMGGVVRSWQRGEWDYSYVKYLPTLGELMQMIERVVTGKGYAEEVTRNYAAALKARVQSLVLGSKGCMLDVRQGIPFEELFGQPTVLELRAMGDDDEKCFLMSLLLTQLYEYREQLYRWAPGPGLRHLTVIEEAHRLLGRAGASASMETANTRGKAVETFANMLAEIREYGEGFIIVDQTPAKLIPDVVKNTSTKILHRLTARDDREFVGDTMGMTEDQRKMVPHLRTGHAVVHMEEQDKPIWVQIDPVKGERRPITDEDVRQQRARQQRERGEAALAAVAPLAESLAVDLRRALELFDEPDIVSPPARPAAARGSLTES